MEAETRKALEAQLERLDQAAAASAEDRARLDVQAQESLALKASYQEELDRVRANVEMRLQSEEQLRLANEASLRKALEAEFAGDQSA